MFVNKIIILCVCSLSVINSCSSHPVDESLETEIELSGSGGSGSIPEYSGDNPIAIVDLTAIKITYEEVDSSNLIFVDDDLDTVVTEILIISVTYETTDDGMETTENDSFDYEDDRNDLESSDYMSATEAFLDKV